jgi:hypothetical protein
MSSIVYEIPKNSEINWKLSVPSDGVKFSARNGKNSFIICTFIDFQTSDFKQHMHLVSSRKKSGL